MILNKKQFLRFITESNLPNDLKWGFKFFKDALISLSERLEFKEFEIKEQTNRITYKYGAFIYNRHQISVSEEEYNYIVKYYDNFLKTEKFTKQITEVLND